MFWKAWYAVNGLSSALTSLFVSLSAEQSAPRLAYVVEIEANY